MKLDSLSQPAAFVCLILIFPCFILDKTWDEFNSKFSKQRDERYPIKGEFVLGFVCTTVSLSH